MYSYKFEKINQLTSEKQLEKGCFLCVWHAHKIPPHIGLIIDGFYFSLKVKGKDTLIPVGEIIKLINKKNICAVFIGIHSDLTKDKVEKIFSNYSNAEVFKFTCLTPISDVFNLREEVDMLADLLNSFKNKNQIGEIFGLNLVSDFKGISSYGKEEIEARLKLLSKT